MGSPTIFTVASFGRSGTVWLSKALNAHPDVMAYHEGVLKQVYPRAWFDAGMTETEHWFSALKDMSRWDVELKTYAAVGDLNSFFGFHRIVPWENEFYRAAMRPRQEKILEGTRAFFLARNPMIALESKWRLLKSNWEYYRESSLWYGREIIALNPETLGEFGPEIARSMEARTFFMLCLHLRYAVRFGLARIYRMEELTSSIEATAKACAEITGVPFDSRQLESVHAKKENALTGNDTYERNDQTIWTQWPAVFQKMFLRLCADLPVRLGYAAVAPADQVTDQVIGLDCPEAPDFVAHHYLPTRAREDYEFAVRLRDLGFAPDSIVDVGGSDGSWTRRIAPLFPSAQLSLFEPLADTVPKFRTGLEVAASDHPGLKLLKVALGNTNGKQLLFLDKNVEMSSCLLQANGTPYTGHEQVMMMTLDLALRKFQIPPPKLLKISVNGLEQQILMGAIETLEAVETLFIECSLQKRFGPGTALLPELVNWLGARGLYLTEILDDRLHHADLRHSCRAIFMRENNSYFTTFGQRRFLP